MENKDQEFLKKVEEAAKNGAEKGSRKNSIISNVPTLLIVILIAVLLIPKVNALTSFFALDKPVDGKDLTIYNYGWFGYTAADFEEAILGDSTKLKKIEVFEQELSDVSTLTETGLFNLGIFSKSQMITYNATVVYTVDLGQLNENDINFDKENLTITIYIPHPQQEEINIPEDKIQFSDPDKGMLAFGDIKMTPEDAYKIQAEARNRMQEKLDGSDIQTTADRFAILSVWELYSPIIKSVSPQHSLIVEFRP